MRVRGRQGKRSKGTESERVRERVEIRREVGPLVKKKKNKKQIKHKFETSKSFCFVIERWWCSCTNFSVCLFCSIPIFFYFFFRSSVLFSHLLGTDAIDIYNEFSYLPIFLPHISSTRTKCNGKRRWWHMKRFLSKNKHQNENEKLCVACVCVCVWVCLMNCRSEKRAKKIMHWLPLLCAWCFGIWRKQKVQNASCAINEIREREGAEPNRKKTQTPKNGSNSITYRDAFNVQHTHTHTLTGAHNEWHLQCVSMRPMWIRECECIQEKKKIENKNPAR